MLQVTQRLFIPIGMLLGALILRSTYQSWSPNFATLLPQLPFVLLGIAAMMALFANHSRDLGLTLAMMSLYWTIQTGLQQPLNNTPAAQIFYLCGILAPLTLGFLLLIPEYGWRHTLGLAAVAAGPLLLLVFSRLLNFSDRLFSAGTARMLADPFLGTRLSDGSGALFVAIALASVVAAFWRKSDTDSSIHGCALMSFTALGWLHLEFVSSSMFTGIGALLILNQVGSLLNISYRDELTQIGNRRALLQAARVPTNIYTIAMVDVDHFKKINDQHGHDFGDQALKVIANQLRGIGDGGKPYRYGGEEFCLLFRNRSRDEVSNGLEDLRRNIAGYDMQVRDRKRPRRNKTGEKRRGASRRAGMVRLSVSMGVADSNQSTDFQSLVRLADKALYRAKANGRNRIELA